VIAGSLAPVDLQLNAFEFCRRDDRVMTVLDVVLLDFAFVHLFLLLEEIDGIGLLELGRTPVLFVCQYGHDGRVLPFLSAGRRGHAHLGKQDGDLMRALALKIAAVYEPDDLRLFFDDLRQTVLSLLIAEEMLVGEGDLAVRSALALAPGHVLGDIPAFFLGDGGHDSNKQFALAIHGVDALLFKVYSYSMLFQLPDRGQRIDCVACEAGDRFCKDEVDLPGQRIIDHTVETLAPFRVRSGYTLVGIDLDEFPIRVRLDQAC